MFSCSHACSSLKILASPTPVHRFFCFSILPVEWVLFEGRLIWDISQEGLDNEEDSCYNVTSMSKSFKISFLSSANPNASKKRWLVSHKLQESACSPPLSSNLSLCDPLQFAHFLRVMYHILCLESVVCRCVYLSYCGGNLWMKEWYLGLFFGSAPPRMLDTCSLGFLQW